MIQLLIAAGADVHVRDCKQRTVLHKTQSVNVIGLMLDAGADVNAVDCKGNTPLHVAASEACLRAIETLIRSGAKSWLMNDEGHTAADVVGSDLRRPLSKEDSVMFQHTLLELACQV